MEVVRLYFGVLGRGHDGDGRAGDAGATTLPMYAVHFPAICFFAAVSPWDRESLPSILFVGGSVLLLVALVTPACDELKDAMRKALAWRPRKAAAA